MSQKSIRIKQKKFDTFDELMDFYEYNSDEIYPYTFQRLKDYFSKNEKCGEVDIYKVIIGDTDNLKYMCIQENEWKDILGEIKNYFVRNEMYNEAANIRNFETLIWGDFQPINELL